MIKDRQAWAKLAIGSNYDQILHARVQAHKEKTIQK